jgi:hypothetical protein
LTALAHIWARVYMSMDRTYLYTSDKARQGVGDAMGYQLAVDVKVVFLDGCAQSWNVNGNVNNTEE